MIAPRPLPGIDPLHLAGDPAAARIVVAMSGGVDSSVAAGLLKEAGHDVVGITLQLYDHGQASGSKGACCAGRDIGDARKVAAHLGIAHYVLDFEQRFREAVIDDFAASYIAGETPVPCVQCNQKVKFRDLLGMARELGAAAMATGHYVRVLKGPRGFELRQPVDGSRDQSWFLFATTREELDFLRFPLGGMTKADVRAHGRRLGLPVADKADSQDICFVPKGHYSTVINTLRPGASGPGEFVGLDGRVLGRHDGIAHYTIGQRKGLGVGARGTESEPRFVVALDAARARVVVGPRDALATQVVRLRDVNWLGDGLEPEAGLEVFARIRSSSPPVAARLARAEDGGWALEFAGTQFGVSPGQACVFYADGNGAARVLGGGWIARAEREALGVAAAAAEEVFRSRSRRTLRSTRKPHPEVRAQRASKEALGYTGSFHDHPSRRPEGGPPQDEGCGWGASPARSADRFDQLDVLLQQLVHELADGGAACRRTGLQKSQNLWFQMDRPNQHGRFAIEFAALGVGQIVLVLHAILSLARGLAHTSVSRVWSAFAPR